MKNTTKNQWQYNCRSYRNYKAKRKFKTYIGIFIICYTLTTSLMSVNSFIALQDDIISQHRSITLVEPVKAEIMPIQKTIEQQIRDIAKEMNFKWTSYLIRLANCESKFDQYALNNNGKYGIDRGIFQISTKFHPEVSTECSMNIRCATEWTINRINAGYQSEWICDEFIK